ncbi:MAG TPA: glycine cleavage T C-terminal barrel domain-containing protein [Phycisphaerae bacterium]|nr:glycine cleavage T C-terminal barrel domain-containing protein [Phycisphaerae bacterium]
MNANAAHAGYAAAISTGGLWRRDDRGLIEITGADRAAWLHNLVTNTVKTLTPGDGVYAFSVNVKGRVVFDMNLLVRPESIWLDVDRRWLESAMKWLDRYHITEDIALENRTDAQRRIAVIGPAAVPTCEALHFGNLTPKAWLQHETRDIGGTPTLMFRHDFTGLIGADFIAVGADRDAAIEVIATAATAAGATPIDAGIVDTLRIEAGLPVSIEDIDNEVIPPETGQIERGISYQKGCYLGQKVLERMRSRGGLARRLVGLKLAGDEAPARGATIHAGESEVGRVTSVAYSPAIDSMMALGYVRTGQSEGASVTIRDGGAELSGEVIAIPVRR